MITYPEIETRQDLTPEIFFNEYVGKRPVVIRGLIKNWRAIELWNEDYFLSLAGEEKIRVKVGTINERKSKLVFLRDYIHKLLKTEHGPDEKDEYLHDVPLPTILDSLRFDMEPFPISYVARWYQYKWWRNLFFFYGKAGSLTPMHFDNLGTHNLFFHVRGRKRFIIIPSSQHKYCYMEKYSWSQVDVEQPNFAKYPLFKKATPTEITLLPGDVLYMPPFTLHQVRSIDLCMSMNMDWHTKESVFLWITKLHKRMRFSRIYYNLVYMFGIIFGIPARYLYPIYSAYLRNG
jgi:ribosomal protein L16 Arg81 hydroxylase